MKRGEISVVLLEALTTSRASGATPTSFTMPQLFSAARIFGPARINRLRSSILKRLDIVRALSVLPSFHSRKDIYTEA
jgi:hypothetical protein